MARTPDEGIARDVFIHVRLTSPARTTLDRLRRGKTRSTYIRELIDAAAANERTLTDDR